MNQAGSTEVRSPLLDSDGNEFRESDNPQRFSESSKEQVIMEEYELSNIAIQEQFYFDAGEKRIISVNVILKSEALYINLQEDGEKRIIFPFIYIASFFLSGTLVHQSERFSWSCHKLSQKKN